MHSSSEPSEDTEFDRGAKQERSVWALLSRRLRTSPKLTFKVGQAFTYAGRHSFPFGRTPQFSLRQDATVFPTKEQTYVTNSSLFAPVAAALVRCVAAALVQAVSAALVQAVSAALVQAVPANMVHLFYHLPAEHGILIPGNIDQQLQGNIDQQLPTN